MRLISEFSADGESSLQGGMYGDYAVAIEGDFGGGTVQFVFVDPDGNELTANTTDWSFTSSPEFPQAWGFPSDCRFKVKLTGATSPNLKVYVTRYYG